MRGLKRVGFLVVAVLMVVGFVAAPVSALVGPHTYSNEDGEVFLGGDYIELGISAYGSFGTNEESDIPAGFYGSTGSNGLGMSTNPAGFGESPDLRMDFFMPGSPEERWAVGYAIGEDTYSGSNSFLRNAHDIADYAVTNQSSGNTLSARGTGTFNVTLEITQVISFQRADKFFTNTVTVENISGSTLDSVRYMRSFDPDNTVDRGGEYDTRNQVLFTHEAGDGKAMVLADTSLYDEDPVYLANGSRSPIFFYSSDERARVSTFGFSNADPYEPEAYDEALPKGTSVDEDQAITIAAELGSLAAGASTTFTYITSLDNRDFNEVLAAIEASDDDGVSTSIENAAPNGGDGNNDGTPDGEQNNVTSLVNNKTGEYVTIETDPACALSSTSIAIDGDSVTGDATYSYPAGLVNFSANCASTDVTLYFYGASDGLTVRKYNPTTERYTTINSATSARQTIGGKSVLAVSYTITDGGELDTDGLVNGTIVDPVGLGQLAVSTPNTGAEPHFAYRVITSILIAVGFIALAGTAVALLMRQTSRR